MIKRLLIIDDMNESLRHGIVCFKVKDEDVFSHFFFTKNKELISFLNNDFSPDLSRDEVYDILNHKKLELEAESFDGEVFSVAHCYTPNQELALKDVKVYLGNKTGAVVISDHMLNKFSSCEMDEFGIKEDDKFFILSACLGVEGNVLEDIYLVNDEGERE